MYDFLFFSAHPDDTEFAAGGTFLKLARKYKVVHIVLTRGEAGTYGTPNERENECREAAKFAGVDIEFLDFIDNHVEDNVENALKLATIIRKYKPTTIFTPYHKNVSFHDDGRAHPDHTALGRLTVKAARFAKFRNSKAQGEPHNASKIIFYLLPQYLKPTFIVDITEVLKDLETLWEIHKTQAAIRDGKIHQILLVERKYIGYMHHIEYAEKFFMESPMKIDVAMLDKI